ncbi:GDP-mannose pyrophosphatase NudK [Desertivirga brevis]|uniref:GDP-mannose pyrophosphatase NudK n=1 Tax=Desertivirga brevis TaxID=2810310 RepID=UPI001A959FC8|nr:GDP-mannose pyrophosphatase NudK [Pedobacter sp. SYSU D00873]
MKDIKITENTLLSDNWYTLRRYTYESTLSSGETISQTREAYDRGNGAVILLYNPELETLILTRQFRLPTFINGNTDGMLIEACAGLLDKDQPEDCIRRETEEETGYRIDKVQKVFEAYMSPGSVTELLYFFIAEYSKGMKVSDGGGLEEEQENIEVLELKFDEAVQMVAEGRIRDAKTIMLIQYLQINKHTFFK